MNLEKFKIKVNPEYTGLVIIDLQRDYCCYKPLVFQPSKMFGLDFHTYLTDMMVSNGNLQLLWHALPKDK